MGKNPIKSIQMNTTTLAVIINYNNTHDTLECYRSCIDSGLVPSDCMIIDNGSSPEVIKTLETEEPAMCIKKLGNNLGYPTAVNAGLTEALKKNYTYTLILNNDIIINQDTIPELIKTTKSNPPCSIAAPINYNYETNTICFSGGHYNFKNGTTPHYSDRPESDRQSDFITASAILINNQTLKLIGFFDDSYFLGYEDADFCLRAKKAGYQLWISAKATVRHKVSKTGKKYLESHYYALRNQLYFTYTYAGIGSKLIFSIKFIHKALKLLLKGLLFPNKNNNDKIAILTLKVIKDFLTKKRGKLDS